MTSVVVTLFAVELLFGGTPRFIDGRLALQLEAFLSLLVIAFGYTVLLVRRPIVGSGWAVGRRERFILLALWIWAMATVLGTTIGLSDGNDINFVVGDVFKFLYLPALFGLLYFGIRSFKEISGALTGITVVYVMAMAAQIAEFTMGSLALHTLTPTALQVPFVLPILLVSSSRLRPRWLRRTAVVGLAEASVMIYVTQSFGLLLISLITVGLFGFLRRPLSRRRMTQVLLVGIAVVPLAMYSLPPTTSAIRDVIFQAPPEQYLALKTQQLFDTDDSTLTQRADRLTGGRLSQLLDIQRYFREHPERLITGSGMGSYLDRTSSILYRSAGTGQAHFIEGAAGEVLFRAGLLALGAFAYLMASFLSRALSLYRAENVKDFGLMCLLFGIPRLIDWSLMGTSLTEPYLIFVVLFVGMILQDPGRSLDQPPRLALPGAIR